MIIQLSSWKMYYSWFIKINLSSVLLYDCSHLLVRLETSWYEFARCEFSFPDVAHATYNLTTNVHVKYVCLQFVKYFTVFYLHNGIMQRRHANGIERHIPSNS